MKVSSRFLIKENSIKLWKVSLAYGNFIMYIQNILNPSRAMSWQGHEHKSKQGFIQVHEAIDLYVH